MQLFATGGYDKVLFPQYPEAQLEFCMQAAPIISPLLYVAVQVGELPPFDPAQVHVVWLVPLSISIAGKAGLGLGDVPAEQKVSELPKLVAGL